MQGQIICVFALVACACALGSSFGQGKVTSGDNAELRQFPHQVSIQSVSITRSHSCGGSILNEYWVITAAHCVVNPPSLGRYVIVAGGVSLKGIEGVEQEVEVKYVYPHPEYTEVVDAFDVALVRVATPFALNLDVAAIALPAKNEVPHGGATISGWGVNGGIVLPNHPDILQFAAVTIEDIAECRTRFPNATLYDTNFCSRGRVAACSEDDGTPLVRILSNGAMELIGITTVTTSPCGEQSQPTIYTQVSSFVDFINGLINA